MPTPCPRCGSDLYAKNGIHPALICFQCGHNSREPFEKIAPSPPPLEDVQRIIVQFKETGGKPQYPSE